MTAPLSKNAPVDEGIPNVPVPAREGPKLSCGALLYDAASREVFVRGDSIVVRDCESTNGVVVDGIRFRDAEVPVTWLAAANDSYFSPAFSKQLAEAFRGAGGRVEFRALPAYGGEGHWLPEAEGGVKLATSELDRALKPARPAAGKR